jgi:hypothetical protein
MRPVVRSPTSAVLSGNTAIASGAVRCVATTGDDELRPLGGAARPGERASGEPGNCGCGCTGLTPGPLPSPLNDGLGTHVRAVAPAPVLQPATSNAVAAAPAAHLIATRATLPVCLPQLCARR